MNKAYLILKLKQHKENMDFLRIVIFISATIFFLGCLGFLKTRNSKKLPPGPKPLPIIGNLHLLGDQPHKSLSTLAKKYGPLMTLQFGRITTVVISSSTLAREVLQRQDLAFSSNRTIMDANRAIDHYKYSAIFLPIGPKWRMIRKMLNSFLFSNNKLDANKHLRIEKVKELTEYCLRSSEKGGAVNIGLAAFTTALNLVSNTLFSEDVAGWNSDSCEEFNSWIRDIMVESGLPNSVDFFPVLRKLDPQGIRRRMTAAATKLLSFVDRIIDKRLTQREQGIVKNDLLDVLLSSIEENLEQVDRDTVVHMILDIFVAGTDTSSNTVEWAMAEVFKNEDIMRKAKEELANVVGKGKTIEEDDVSNLPYLQCIVKETFRLHPAAPLLIPRKVGQDNIEVGGFLIPKGSQVLVNAWTIGRDPSIWECPMKFIPERFWNSQMDVRGQHFELIPFGAGRRLCPGLPLGIKMVHIMLGSLLNSFNWKLEGDLTPKTLDMDDHFGMVLQKAQPLLLVPVTC